MRTMLTRLAVLLFLATGLLSLTVAGVEAQEDKWSFVVTPQVWISHIAKNGFAAPPSNNFLGQGIIIVGPGGSIDTSPFQSESSPNEGLNPQWGIQFAAQKGRWTLSGAFQYVTFETRNDITYQGQGNLPLCFFTCIQSGQRWAQEFINTTRMDIDLAASYFFPDVVNNRLDVSLGGGFKFIYASASREFGNLSSVAAEVNGFPGFGPGLYTICHQDTCNSNNALPKDRVKEKSEIYGATFPMNATLHLTNDAKWLLPFSITPLIGVEHRNDENVAYSVTLPSNVSQLGSSPPQVNRLDGNTFAYGVTADATVRWIINETVSAYAGMRVQYINAHDVYLAYGPLLGMSVRFGGK
jgi:hypothetical protein